MKKVQNQGMINSKRQRKLNKKRYVESSTMSFPLPAGEVVKRFIVKVKGWYKHTYASGTPVPATQVAGVAHALFRNIRVLTDGGKLHKQVDVKWMREQAKLINGSDAKAFYKNNSAAVGASPSEGFAGIGATTQKTAFFETFEIPMEAVISSASAISYLNLKGQSSAVIEIDTNAIESLVLPSDSVTYSDIEHEIDIEISMTTAPHFRDQSFETFRQTSKVVGYAGAQNATPIELNRGARIAGCYIELVNGVDGSALTIEEADQCEFQIVRNGTEVLRSFTLQELVSENLAGTPLQELLPACGYVSFLNNRNIQTALNTMVGSGVQALDLLVTLPSSLDYTYPVKVKIKQDEFLRLI